MQMAAPIYKPLIEIYLGELSKSFAPHKIPIFHILTYSFVLFIEAKSQCHINFDIMMYDKQ